MGTEITLDIDDLSITYAKNCLGFDHGSLFQEMDRKRVESDQINYDYFEREGEDPASMEMAFVRSLQDIVPRLELLGFNLYRVRREYEKCVAEWKGERSSVFEKYFGKRPEPMSFSEFQRFATQYPIASLDNTYVDRFDSEGRRKIQGRFNDKKVTSRIPNCNNHGGQGFSERSYFGELVNILHPYSVMRLLADEGTNDQSTVVWQYGPLVESGGWATEDEFISCAKRTETFLIVTEGSSDVHILQHALNILRPDIADFFRFIDVSESHPFSGTGNLVRFAEGLVKIDVQNQIIFLFDNDAEGLEAYRRVANLSLPTNMRGVLLPDLKEFRSFPAQGPEGTRNSNINGKAAAIECYLDLKVGKYPSAKVRWTNYKKSLKIYQGALEHKEFYAKDFLRRTPECIKGGSYNTTKIEKILDILYSECSSMALDLLESNLEKQSKFAY